MAYNYIYIDDETPSSILPHVKAVLKNISNNEVTIKPLPPLAWDDINDALNQENYDGLILDLKLNQSSFWTDNEYAWRKENIKKQGKARYTASELAQYIRTLSTDKKLPDCPIVLWSTEKRIKKSAYSKDQTSHDLFDMKTLKEDLVDSKKAKEVANQLIALAKGYKELQKIKNSIGNKKSEFYKFLGWKKDPEFLDPRLLNFFNHDSKSIPIHWYAHFILENIIKLQGPLIDENILAARLGIDKNNSRDFPKLLELIPRKAKYNGPFKEGWQRWWEFQIVDWWNSLKGSPQPLKTVIAEKRVSHLKKITNLKKLSYFKSSKKKYKTNYWTICQCTKLPLSTNDGFLVDFQGKLPWQTSQYVSMEAIEKRLLKKNKISIDPLEKSRLQREKKL